MEISYLWGLMVASQPSLQPFAQGPPAPDITLPEPLHPKRHPNQSQALNDLTVLASFVPLSTSEWYPTQAGDLYLLKLQIATKSQ